VLWPDGTWQPSLRRFPTVVGTVWRRTPLRLLRDPYRHQVSHYGTRPDEPVQGDWLLGGACLLVRRSMLDDVGGWDAGFRHYVEDIDLAYRAAAAGWERWLVPSAVVHHDYAAVVGQAFPRPAHALARARDGPLPAQAPERLLAPALAARPRLSGMKSKPTWAPSSRTSPLDASISAGMNVGFTVTSTW
jgi:hypothetical protein